MTRDPRVRWAIVVGVAVLGVAGVLGLFFKPLLPATIVLAVGAGVWRLIDLVDGMRKAGDALERRTTEAMRRRYERRRGSSK